MPSQYSRKFVILFLFLVTAVLLIANVQAQDQEPPTPERLNPEQFEPVPYLETDLADEYISRPNSPNVTTWGKVVFQSYRNGNWEIYTMDDDGSNQWRLTNHAKSDIHPRLNRGNTQIVFASNRDGDYEIYVMNPDGSGLKQLTNNSTDDVNPVWSFDGTKLAFQAYRDGQAEIYTMNSNGTAQTRLTINSAYEGMPSWSPDGQKIAFVSNRSGGYRIYVMNSQTGGGQTQLSNQPNSFNPIWSPDGTKIAYDADGDGDGWQDIWIMDADGSNQIARYNPSGQVDAWVRSWFGKYLIAFTEISFTQYQGAWYWTQAYASYTRFDDYTFDDRFNSANKTDWNPDWQSSDAIAPVSFIATAPFFLQQNDEDSQSFTHACWNVYDEGGSGQHVVEVEYRHENDVDWTFHSNVYVDDISCGDLLPLIVDDDRFGWFEYRGHAYDYAFNHERTPSQPQFRSLVYEWRLETTMQDVRGNYLANAQISAANLLHKTTDDSLNEQIFYFSKPADPIVGWLSDGFLSLPQTTHLIVGDYFAKTNVYMPAADNLINDWGFENGDLSAAWMIDGTQMFSTSEQFHTGELSAYLSENLRAISQTVTIPNTMTNPTLSFLTRGRTTNGADGVVTISDEAGEASLVFSNSGNSWQQTWFDMSSWSGKTITITFSYATTDDYFYLDEVTLGSAHPNVWIDIGGDLAARPGEPLIYEINFGNNTNLDAHTNIITLTLPTDVNFVSASIPPTVNGNVLTWEIGDLLADSDTSMISVTANVKAAAPTGTFVEAQVEIESATPELVLENNTAVFSTFVGDLIYLPFVTRN